MNQKKGTIIDLDECVINALKLFFKQKIPELNISYKNPLVLGSGNAIVTGKIMFENNKTVFGDEGNYKQILKNSKSIDGAVLISSSGKKHSVKIAKHLKKKKIHTTLITNNKKPLAGKYVNKTITFPKNKEPYTYNTSTYMGMILAKNNENLKKIFKTINKKIKPNIPKNLLDYNAFMILIPPEFEEMKQMFLTKFDELFGPIINGRVFTHEEVKHAKTVVTSSKELIVSFGKKNKHWGENKLDFKLPKKIGPAGLMAIIYYFIGSIQKQHPPYFKNEIKEYVKKISKIFNQDIKLIS